MLTNALSIDVEGFAESNAQSFAVPSAYFDQHAVRYELERNIDALLELLSDLGVRATFFFLGTAARNVPNLVSYIARLGHEVGSHSYKHVRVFDVPEGEFRENLASAKHELEEISGTRVYGFRAPDFSITRRSLWAIEVLRELGFVYDSSVYPIGFHPVYGIREAEPSIHLWPNGLIEFPLPTIDVGGGRVPFGGGGYLRLYPVAMTKALVRRTNRRGNPCMLYIHPYEVGPVVPRIPDLPWQWRFRCYYNIHRGARRLRRLLTAVPLSPAIDILRERRLLAD